MSKIYKVDFEDKNRKTKTISELFESIQFYRSQGKSLSSIHAAFKRAGLWKKSLSSFLSDYYQCRRSLKGSDIAGSRAATKLGSASSQKVESVAPSAASPIVSHDQDKAQIDSRTGIKSEMTLEERREISARLFKQNQSK
ncbi:MAG: hypothetical protein AB8B99_17585 [Phormidesmis sp.]